MRRLPRLISPLSTHWSSSKSIINNATLVLLIKQPAIQTKFCSCCSESKNRSQDKSAEQGLPESQYRLSQLFYDGSGTAKDNTKEFEWALKAANQGHVEAQNFVAERYAKGEGVIRNESLAMDWFLKAAQQGYSYSQLQLALLYHKQGDNDLAKMQEFNMPKQKFIIQERNLQNRVK